MPADAMCFRVLCRKNSDLAELLQFFATVQPAELLQHPAIENRFAMGRMPTGTMLSYGLCSKCTDLIELLQFFSKI